MATSTSSPDQDRGRKRREHRRSRGGCQACRSRHVKCDEKKPLCGHCLIRGLSCEYPEHDSSATGSPELDVTFTLRRLAEASNSRTSAAAIGPPMTFLPATPADPFNTLPVPMTPKTQELYQHFMYYRNIIRNTLPKNPSPAIIGLEATIPAWFSARLLFAAAHHDLLTNTTDEYSEPSLYYLKSEVIRALQGQLDSNPAGNLQPWCITVISCMIFIDTIFGDFAAAEAHLHGVFTLLDLKVQRGPEDVHFYVHVQKRIILITLGLTTASRKRRPRTTLAAASTPPQDRQAWANVAYLYTHAVNEFVRNKPLTTPDIFPARTDTALLRWLAESGRRRASPPETRAAAADELRRESERWERRAAVAAYALTVGSLPVSATGRAVEVEAGCGGSELASLRAWFEGQMASWVAAEGRAENACHVKEAVVAKTEWLLKEEPAQIALLSELVALQAG